MEAATEWALRFDPAKIMSMVGLTADPWQAAALRTQRRRVLICAARQSGKSTTVAAIAVNMALLHPGSLTLLTSLTERQSCELLSKVVAFYRSLGEPIPVARQLTTGLELVTGSRVLALPGDERTVRCFSDVNLLIVDEASLVPDELYVATMPMLAVSAGQLIALSTPAGRRGFFATNWNTGGSEWERISARASQCPRISAEFLADQRRLMSERDFAQEYECEFADTIGAVFRSVERSIDRGRTHETELDNRAMARNGWSSSTRYKRYSHHAGVDLARLTDYTAICVIDSSGRQVYAERFNRISWERQISIVEHVAKTFDCAITLDVSSMGDVVHEELRRRRVEVLPYRFTHQSKADLIEGLAMMLEQLRIRLLDDPIQESELKAFEYSTTRTGLVTTGAPPGGHDDMVISLALAAFSYNGGGYYSAA